MRSKSYRRWIFSILVILTTSAVHAQFNDSTNHYIYVGSTGAFNKTNDLKSYVLNNAVKFTISKKAVSFHTAHSWIYGQQSDVKINNDFSSVVELDFLKNKRRFYYWAMGTFDKSYSLKIDYRFQGGLGVGYYVIDNPEWIILLSDGFIFEKGNLTDKVLGDRNYDVWRNSARVKYRWVLSDIFILDGSAFVQPSITTSHDTIIKSSTTLSLKLKKWLSVTSSVTYNRITLTERENLFVTYGVVLERFF
ncbi:MAG: DUF481 domain-containing protein [Chryseolinea sp.]